ncbi:MAG: hypothetical protein AABZ22_05930 [Nitrospirota bacterium]
MPSVSLYERLGEKPATQAIVDDFIVRVAADTVSGGAFTYIGWDMKSAYAGKGITNAEFDALVGDLVTTLNKFNIGEREQTELLWVLGTEAEGHRRAARIIIQKRRCG